MAKDFYIRPVETLDYPFMVKWGNNYGLRKQMLSKKPTNALEQKEYIGKLASVKSREALCICRGKAQREGICEIYNIDFQNRSCSLSVYIEDKERVLAVHGFDILKSVLQYIFSRLGLYKVSVELLLDDKEYITLYKQFGFTLELTRPAHRYDDGEFKTVVELALFKKDFEIHYGRS